MASPRLARASSLVRGAFTVASGGFAGSVSAVTGLGGAVVFIPALSKLGYEARHIVGTAVVRHGDTIHFGPVEARFEDPAFPTVGDEPTTGFDVPEIQTGPHLSPRQTEVLELTKQIKEQVAI